MLVGLHGADKKHSGFCTKRPLAPAYRTRRRFPAKWNGSSTRLPNPIYFQRETFFQYLYHCFFLSFKTFKMLLRTLKIAAFALAKINFFVFTPSAPYTSSYAIHLTFLFLSFPAVRFNFFFFFFFSFFPFFFTPIFLCVFFL